MPRPGEKHHRPAGQRRRFLETVGAGSGAALLFGAKTTLASSRPAAGKGTFVDDVMALPVWDTHNHLDSSEHLCAQSLWDMAHYFWFVAELQGVGYPPPAAALKMPETQRAEAFLRAYAAGRNTTWNQAFRRTLKDLWNVEITDAKSVLEADARIADTGRRRGWAREVCDRISIAKLTIPELTRNGLHEIADRTYVMGHFPFSGRVRGRHDEADPRQALESFVKEGDAEIDRVCAQGARVFRVSLPREINPPELRPGDNPRETIAGFLGHAILNALDRNHAHAQVFLGVERMHAEESSRDETGVDLSYPSNDPQRITSLHPLFRKYPRCTFEIVNAAQLSDLDIVQAAGIYPNVVPGGLWWFNFRPSVYRATMQYRLEALPASRSTLLASDARSIEWCYCKTLLVKRLLSKFLADQIGRGWLDRETALFVAKEWLHDAAARMYAPGGRPAPAA